MDTKLERSNAGMLSPAFQYRFKDAGLRCDMVTQRNNKDHRRRFHRKDLDRFRSLKEQGYDMRIGYGGVDLPRWKEPSWVVRLWPREAEEGHDLDMVMQG